MKWIKLNYEKPETEGYYFVIESGVKRIIYFDRGFRHYHDSEGYQIDVDKTIWLREYDTSSELRHAFDSGWVAGFARSANKETTGVQKDWENYKVKIR